MDPKKILRKIVYHHPIFNVASIQAQKKIDQINQSLEESSIRAIFYSSIANPSIRFVNILVSMAVLLFGGAEVIKGIITLGQFSVFFSYASIYF